MSRAPRVSSRLSLSMRGMVAAAFLLGQGASSAWATSYNDIEVSVQPQPALEGSPVENHPGGYIEHRVVVRNRSKTKDHKVRLIQPAKTVYGYPGDYLERNSRTVQVAHGATLVVSLFQPSLSVTDEHLGVEIDGFEQKDAVELPCPFGRGTGYFYSAPGTRPSLVALASRGIPQELKDKVRDAHPNEIEFCRSELPASEWSPNWLGYTGYDLLLLTEQEAASLPADVLLAIRRYAEVGGIVLVQGSSSDPKTIVPEALRDPSVAADENGTFHVGFGLVRPAPGSTPWPAEFWTVRAKGTIAPIDREVQIAGEISVPVRGLLVLVIFFAIGIGPVNVWLLSRRQKKMWLWWNVPALSFATCLTVFGYSIFSEGLTGRGRTALLTLLDENTHRATTLGYASYYCPLTPSNGLHFSYDTEAVQLHSLESTTGLMSRVGRGKSIDWTNDQHLVSGWIVARVPACFGIRKSETRRERLTVRRGSNDKLTVVNGLGVQIDSLYYRDENGVVGVATDLAAGQERLLEPSKSGGTKPPDGPQLLRGIFEQTWNVSLKDLRSFPEKYVSPGCYVAVVKRSPFLEDPLVAAPQNGSLGVIYGIGARPDNGR